MEMIVTKKSDGSQKIIFVDHTISPPQKLTYNELAQYHRLESKKYTK